MNIVTRAGWILIGVLVGVLATHSMSAATVQESNESRLKLTMMPSPIGTIHFLRDTKSNGCWLVIDRATGASLAVAPAEACQTN
jgi:hypothetical protein